MTEGKHTLIAGDDEILLRSLPIETGGIRSRRVFKGAGASVVRLSLDEGQVMREHTATAPIFVQVLSGHAALDVGGERVDMPAGAIIHVDANLPHSVEALTPAHLLLILCERAPGASSRTPRPGIPAKATVPDATGSAGAGRSHVILASSGPDSDAVERVTARHAAISGSLAAHATQLLEAAAGGDTERIRQARAILLDWCHGSLSELLDAEQAVFGPALRGIDADLADRLRAEREHITGAIGRLADLRGSIEIATAAVALRVQINHHLRSFADHALPVLAGEAGLPLTFLWSEIESLATEDSDRASRAAVALCECGIVDQPELPELDVRDVPHAIRHATVFGALDAIGAGEGLILVAPHDPLPLLAQIEQRAPGRFAVSYLDRGPTAWRLRLSAAPVA